jgi:hypothetical protein
VFKVGSLRMCYAQFLFSFRLQVFVANPKKPPQIEIILRRNKEKLLNFLKSFHNDKEGAMLVFFLFFYKLEFAP